MMLKRLGKPSIWEKSSKAEVGLSAWLVICSVAFFMAFIWGFTLLSYLIDPFQLYADIFSFELSGGPLIFLCVSTVLFFTDFVLARHLFCKYGCAVGIFQSLLWMANKKALIVSFESSRASAEHPGHQYSLEKYLLYDDIFALLSSSSSNSYTLLYGIRI